jgi:hypothetical protein
MAKRSNAGGGPRSKNVVQKSVRVETGAKAKVVAGVAQLGQAAGNHVTERGATSYGGVSMRGGAGYNPVKYGNEVALNVGAGVNRGEPMPKAKPLWEGWEK